MHHSQQSDGWAKCETCENKVRLSERIIRDSNLCAECHQKASEKDRRVRDRMQASGIYPRHSKWIQDHLIGRWFDGVRKMGGNPEEVMRATDRVLIDGLEIAALLGPRGTGKTQLASCWVDHAIRHRDRSAKITPAWDMLCELKRARSFSASREVQERARKPYEDPWLLVIDEFQVRLDSATERAELQTLIDWRYGQGNKVTVIISNLTEKGFREMAGESLVSRLQEVGGIVEFNWRSFRLPPPEEGSAQ